MAYLEKTQITNEKDVLVNPASEEAITLLRRMVKIMESQSAIDLANRQRIVVDAGALTLAAGANTVGSTINAAGANTVGYFGMTGDTRTDLARNTYANSIRNKLTFS